MTESGAVDALAPVPPVPLDSITKAAVEIPLSVGDGQALRERETFAHAREQFRHELGWLGKPFGGRREKPGNISALVIIACFVLLGGAFAVQTWETIAFAAKHVDPVMPFERIFGGVTSIITLVLGYLFGSNERHDDK